VSTLGLESVLVGDVVHGVGLAIVTDVRELPLGDLGFLVGAGVLEVTLFAELDALLELYVGGVGAVGVVGLGLADDELSLVGVGALKTEVDDGGGA